MLLWLAEIYCVKIQTNCKAEHLLAQHRETRIYILEVELKNGCYSDCERTKILGLNLTTCQRHKTKNRYGVGNKMKMI